MKINDIKVWNFDLPPFPREGLFHLDMSEHCQVTRFLKWEASRLAHVNQLDIVSTEKELKTFQASLRRKIRQKLNVDYDSKLPLDVRRYGTCAADGFTIEKLIYQSRPGIYVTALLYIPEGKGPFPAVLQMHGHNPEGKFGVNVQKTSMALVKNGFVCLAVDAIGCFERAQNCYKSEYHGNVLGGHVMNIGETLMGQQIVDNMRGIDLLQSLDCVIKDQIGATGASGGGNQTMWLAALDERVKAAMPVVSVGSFQSYVYGMNCMCELLPDGLTMTEISGILALIAPRHLKIGNALYDCNHDFSVAEMLKSYHPVERIYWNLNQPEKISFYVADRVHGYSDRQREAALGFFEYALKGQGNGNPVREPDAPLIDMEELKLFSEERPRPAEVASLQDICRKKGKELHEKLLAREHFSVAAERKNLKKLLRMRPVPAAGKLTSYAEVSGVKRYALTVGEQLLPFLYYKPENFNGTLRIICHPEGKAMLDSQICLENCRDGSALILPDLFGTGETCQQAPCGGLHHQFFRQLLWLGRSLMGEWMFGMKALAQMAKKEFKAQKVFLHGVKECGTAALWLNAVEKGIDGVTLIDAPASLLFDDRTVKGYSTAGPFAKFLPNAIYSLAAAQPGFLCWGDISLAEALNETPVTWVSPRSSDGTPLTEAEMSAHNEEVRGLQKKLEK